MPGVTEREIAQAKQMNLYQYMQLCEPDNFKPEGPGQFRHKGHSSLSFAENGTWTYFKTHATGRTAVDYLIKVEGVPFVEAVRQINRIQGGCIPSFQSVQAPTPPVQPKPPREFRLPQPDPNCYAATAYLRKRCIHPNVLSFCKQKKILYQTSIKNHPNCVFVGRDGEGQAKGGSLRGCGAQQFRRDIPGSRKIYPFYIEATAETDKDYLAFRQMEAMIVEKELFLNPRLGREDIVKATGIGRNTIAPIIRKCSGCVNLNDYINRLRLEHAVKLMKSNRLYTIDSIAESSGFNSRSTFYRAFQNVFGMSPLQYLEIQKKENADSDNRQNPPEQ